MALVCSKVALAVPVGLENGQGWMFNHRGNCYLIVPQHVVGNKRELQFFTENPIVHGDARVMRNFKTVNDLAIAFVAPGLQDRCTTSWDSMPSDISNVLRAGASLTLSEVRSSGLVDSVEGTVRAYDANKIFLAPDKADSMYQGRSGSALLRNGVFIGMAVKAEGSDIGEFLRADEIHDDLRGLIGRSNSVTRPPSNQLSKIDHQCSINNDVYTGVLCSSPTLTDSGVCSDLMTGKTVQFPADSLPLIIELTLSEGSARRLTRFSHSVQAPISDNTTVPRSVLVLVDSSKDKRKRWKKFGSRDSAPNGSVQVNNGSKPLARRIQFIVQSSWDAGKPVEVGCLTPG